MLGIVLSLYCGKRALCFGRWISIGLYELKCSLKQNIYNLFGLFHPRANIDTRIRFAMGILVTEVGISTSIHWTYTGNFSLEIESSFKLTLFNVYFHKPTYFYSLIC